MNKIIVIGNLGRDPEMTYTPQGTEVAKFTVASQRFANAINLSNVHFLGRKEAEQSAPRDENEVDDELPF